MQETFNKGYIQSLKGIGVQTTVLHGNLSHIFAFSHNYI